MANQEKDYDTIYRRVAIASNAFSPSAPINRVTLFAGRHDQVMQAIDIAYRRGQHGIVFGERGVGKTSFANLIGEFLSREDRPDKPPRFLTPRINCSATSDYDSIWRELFGKISYFQNTQPDRLSIGDFGTSLGDEKLSPGKVQKMLDAISTQSDLIVTIDEFDRVHDSESKRLMADTIKALSDHSLGATIFLVGVADTVDQLLSEHQSVARAMMQIRMPRMTDDEIADIVKRGLDRFNSECEDFQLKMTEESLGVIVALSRGLPHYTHLTAQKACYSAIEAEESEISPKHVGMGISSALNEVQQTTLQNYDTAVYSAHKNATLCESLTACALAAPDRMGFFSASDVRGPLSNIRGKDVQIASFSNHLEEFCLQKRGAVLERKGERRQIRYRFTDALMQPYVIMRAYTENRLPLPTQDKRE